MTSLLIANQARPSECDLFGNLFHLRFFFSPVVFWISEMQHRIFGHSGFLRTASCALIAACLAGCGQAPGPQRVAISGEVLFGTEPLESGRIHFIPIEGTQGPAAVALVTDGVYSFERNNGPVVGTNKIMIESVIDPGFEIDDEVAYAEAVRARKGRPVLPREVIPPEYNTKSNLVATVSLDEPVLDFELKKSEVAQKH